jgi:hypothetical protein
MREAKIQGDLALKVIEFRLSGMSAREIANVAKQTGLADISRGAVDRFLQRDFPHEQMARLGRKQLAVNESNHAFLIKTFYDAIAANLSSIIESIQARQLLAYDDLYRLERFIRRHGEEIERLARISGALPAEKTEINVTIAQKLINEVHAVVTKYVPKDKQKGLAERIREAVLAGTGGQADGEHSFSRN